MTYLLKNVRSGRYPILPRTRGKTGHRRYFVNLASVQNFEEELQVCMYVWKGFISNYTLNKFVFLEFIKSKVVSFRYFKVRNPVLPRIPLYKFLHMRNEWP